MPSQLLLKRERHRFFNTPAICTATFFEGSFSLAGSHFKTRFNSVLRSNPWLAGKIDKSKVEAKLTYSNEPQLNDVFSLLDSPIDISPDTEYELLLKTCSTYSIGTNGSLNGHQLAKLSVPVCRLVVAPTKQVSQFVVLFSISHAIADGYTYYEILNMLTDSASVTIRALNPQRKMDFEQLVPKLMSPPVSKFLTSLTFLKAYLMGFLRKPKAKAMAYFVDESKVQQAKKRCTTGFVSTNDILTSHFMNASAPIRLGTMAINYRPRCSVLDKDDAGNYQDIVLSDIGGYSTPEAIRSSLVPNTEGSFVGLTNPLPGFFSKCPLAFITNVALKGTDPPFDLSFAKQQLQMPILYLGVSIPNFPMDMAMVFRPVPDRLAVLYIAKQSTPDKLLGSTSSVLGDSVSKSMFPVSDSTSQAKRSCASMKVVPRKD